MNKNLVQATLQVSCTRFLLVCHGHNTVSGAVLGKNMGGGLALRHLGGNNEQNYCVQLSSIKQLMYNLCTVITLKTWGAWARFWGACAPWPKHRTATARSDETTGA